MDTQNALFPECVAVLSTVFLSCSRSFRLERASIAAVGAVQLSIQDSGVYHDSVWRLLFGKYCNVALAK